MEFKEKLIDYFNQLISYNINLVDYAHTNKINIYVNGKLNKGWKGHVIEHMLNLPKNSNKGSDYNDLEIKTVPVVIKQGNLSVKETTCLSVIDINNLLKQPFENSDLYKKINKTLFVLIDTSDENYPKIHSTLYIDFNKQTELIKVMKEDYENLVCHVLDNIDNDYSLDYHFSGKLGQVIQPRPKTGKKGDYIWAFYLKKNVLESFLIPEKPIKKKLY